MAKYFSGAWLTLTTKRALRSAWASRWRDEVAIFCIFVAVTIAMTWPYAKLASTHFPAVGIEDGLCLGRYTKNFHDWILGRRPGGLFDFDIFFPHPLSGTTTDPAFGVGVMTLPLRAFTNNYLLLINLAILATFPLVAHGTYLLTRELTGSRAGGIFAGLAFAFCFYRLSRLNHVHILQMQWLPYALTYLHRIQRDASWKNAILLGLFVFAACCASCNVGIYSVLIFPIAGSFVIATAPSGTRWRCASRILFGGALGALLSIPVYYPYYLVASLWLSPKEMWEIRQYSGRVESFFAAPSSSALYAKNAVYAFNEGQMFVGFLVLVFAAIGIVWFGRAARGKPMTWSRYLYLALAALYALVCLGPEIRFKGTVVAKGIWHYVTALPGYAAVRTPSRFYFISIMCLAILAGCGVAMVLARVRVKWLHLVLSALFSMGVLFELRATPIEMRPLDASPRRTAPYRALAAAPQPGAVVDLPLSWDEDIRTRMYHAMIHGRPTVDSMSSYGLAYFGMMEDAQFRGEDGLRTISELNAAGLRYVIVRSDALNEEQRTRYVSLISSVGAKLWNRVGDNDIYELAAPPKTVALQPGGASAAITLGSDRWGPSGTTVTVNVRFTSKSDDFIFERGPRWFELDLSLDVPGEAAHVTVPFGLAPALMAPHKPNLVVWKYLALKVPPGNYRTAYRVREGHTIWGEGELVVTVNPPKP